ncbi:MAG: tetratricopeptide repeat protein [Desulfobacterales bacterium]|nr:tetratricopeptide repeat protein [Desulfobacterales bacterium]
MEQDTFKRKLTTVLSADAVGYSKLMGDDEAATVKTITAYQKIMTDLIMQHRGRVIDSPGDNMLAEFGSVVDAVQCAVAIQKELQARNDHLPDNRRMLFRIGINLGDVIQEGERIYGDGVNIAARLEGLAEPGGICISKTAFDHIATKLPYGYDFLGDQSVKNIDKPVGAYRVSLDPRVSDAVKPVSWQKSILERSSYKVAIITIIVIAAALWLIPFPWQQPAIETASEANMAYSLPEEPSVAVMPLKPLGGTDEEKLLAEGISTSVITALSKTPKLFTVDYESTSKYKGEDVSIKAIAEDMGVRYVLEGDLQKSGDKVRINVKLIDALSGKNLWAEKYDRPVDDLFVLQDDITMEIIKALQVELFEGEYGNIIARGTDSLEAFLKIVQGYQYWKVGNKDGDIMANRLANKAIELDPDYAAAYSLLSRTIWRSLPGRFGYAEDPEKTKQEAFNAGLKAVELDYSADTLSWLGILYHMMRQRDKGLQTGEKALALNPHNSRTLTNLGLMLRWAGRCKEAIPLIDKAIRISPRPSANILFSGANAYRDCQLYDECIALGEKAVQLEPDSLFSHLGLTCCYALSGQMEKAQASTAEVLRIRPNFKVRDRQPSGPNKEADIRRRKAWVMAGLPTE